MAISSPPFSPVKSRVSLSLREISYRVTRGFKTHWQRAGLWFLYLLATVQFVGAQIYLEWPYLNVQRWEHGRAPLPFQTRILLAPLYRWWDDAAWSRHYATGLAARNHYFFHSGVRASMVLEFWLGIASVLFTGWVAVRIYDAAGDARGNAGRHTSRFAGHRDLLRPLVFPCVLMLCVLSYIVHTVQNFRFVYDLPSMAFFSAGLYLIYFRKPLAWFLLLFAVATINRETTLLMIPFWAVSQVAREEGRLDWRGLPGLVSLRSSSAS